MPTASRGTDETHSGSTGLKILCKEYVHRDVGGGREGQGNVEGGDGDNCN